ncbi:basigin [Rhinatrema bivittatum]|uniref:basigin n=1 Tax=Rhinatrema bivittatum TaxID=194408 RepID=UPI00112D37BB|nr:basigin [Rhinatrema bivittatum]
MARAGSPSWAARRRRLLLLAAAVTALLCRSEVAGAAGFIKSPLSEVKLTKDNTELHCEVLGQPVPEIQWWFEAGELNETFSQLWDGMREDRVQIHATYGLHATSTIFISNLTVTDSGLYECRASNDPDRNHLSKNPRIKWIRSQANVLVIEHPLIITNSSEATSGPELLSCNLTEPPSQVTGHKWMKGDKVLEADTNLGTLMTYNISEVNGESSGVYHCIFLTEPAVKGTINVSVTPHVVAYHEKENKDENDVGVLICKCSSYPPVDQWSWYRRSSDEELTPMVNGTDDRFIIKASGNKTELHIAKLEIEKDQGEYVCKGTNHLGSREATIMLRVRSRLAALWPFLGIVAEVVILVTIIFIYEKRRKPDEVPDDDDGGSAPLKSNTSINNDNVRQRNSN